MRALLLTAWRWLKKRRRLGRIRRACERMQRAVDLAYQRDLAERARSESGANGGTCDPRLLFDSGDDLGAVDRLRWREGSEGRYRA